MTDSFEGTFGEQAEFFPIGNRDRDIDEAFESMTEDELRRTSDTTGEPDRRVTCVLTKIAEKYQIDLNSILRGEAGDRLEGKTKEFNSIYNRDYVRSRIEQLSGSAV